MWLLSYHNPIVHIIIEKETPKSFQLKTGMNAITINIKYCPESFNKSKYPKTLNNQHK